MTRNRLLIGLGCAAILCIAAALDWYLAHRPIAYHNECIRSAIHAATRIEVSTITQTEHRPKEVTVSNRADIVSLLNQFRLPWTMRASGEAHSCVGHLRVRIIMPTAPNYDVQYDHGIGIYPIKSGGDDPGFCQLPKNARDYLNGYFVKLGYERTDLGVGEMHQITSAIQGEPGRK